MHKKRKTGAQDDGAQDEWEGGAQDEWEGGAQDEWDFLSVRYFLHVIFPVFKIFQKIPLQCWN